VTVSVAREWNSAPQFAVKMNWMRLVSSTAKVFGMHVAKLMHMVDEGMHVRFFAGVKLI